MYTGPRLINSSLLIRLVVAALKGGRDAASATECNKRAAAYFIYPPKHAVRFSTGFPPASQECGAIIAHSWGGRGGEGNPCTLHIDNITLARCV